MVFSFPALEIKIITYNQRATENFIPGSENKPSLLENISV